MRKIFPDYIRLALLLSFILFLSCSLFADNKTDSLRNVISTQQKSKEKADNLVELSKQYYYASDWDNAIFFGKESVLLSSELEYTEGMMDGSYILNLVYQNLGEFDKAMSSIREYLEMAELLNDSIKLAKGYNSYASILHSQGNSFSAINYYHKAIGVFKTYEDHYKTIAVCNALGNLFQDISAYDSATIYYLEGVQLAEEHGFETLLGTFYNNLGKTFSRLDDFKESNTYLEKSLEINKQNQDTLNIVLNYMNMGNNYLHMEEYDIALVYYDKVSELLESKDDVINEADMYNNYALVYMEMGKYELALEYFDKALLDYQKRNFLDGIMIAMKNMGDVYSLQGKYQIALQMYDSSLNMAVKYSYENNELDFLEAIAVNYADMGDHENSLAYFKRYIELYKSLFDLDQTKVINDLKLKYEKEQDQIRILETDLILQKRTTQRNAYFFTGIGVIALALFMLLYFRQKAQINKQKVLQLEEEKKLLAAKLLVEGQEEERKRIARELHDGLGVLLSATKMQFTNIKDVSPENRPLIEKATQMLEQASGDVRKISHNMMPGLLTKLGFIDAVEDMFDNLNDMEDMEARCEIIGELEERLPENKEIMLYRIVQEMVNNTLKHAKANSIALKIKIFPGQLHLLYSDDGKGFDVEKTLKDERGAFGLKSLQSRVNFLNGDLDIQSSPDKGVLITISVSI